MLKEVNAGVLPGSVARREAFPLPTLHISCIKKWGCDTRNLCWWHYIISCKGRPKSYQQNLWVDHNLKIKINKLNSVYVNFTNNKLTNPLILNINDTVVHYQNNRKYLSMVLDAKLWWKENIKSKRAELDFKFKEYYWLLRRNSKLSTDNKILNSNQILKLMWLYGMQLWGCSKDTNIATIQKF